MTCAANCTNPATSWYQDKGYCFAHYLARSQRMAGDVAPSGDAVLLTDEPVTLRRAASERAYSNAKRRGRTRPLVDEPAVAEWQHWKIVENRYPYDLAFKRSDILLPKRRMTERYQLTLDEQDEYDLKVWPYICRFYDAVMENVPRKRSVPSHWHAHLLKYYGSREEIVL